MHGRLEQEYYLRALDVDIKGEWMPSAIFVRMQEIAEDHAVEVGYGRVNMVDTLGLAWVLTRLNLRMEAYPKLGQTIRAATWPLKPNKLLFLRHFMFWGEDGTVLGRASSQWVLFDINDRVIRRTNTIGDYPHDPGAVAALEEPGKIILPKDMEKADERTVLYSEVDMNGHMNNTKYLNWICELFPNRLLERKRMKDVKINYVAEAQLGQRVELYKAEGDGGWYICGSTEGKTVFDSFVTWMD